MKLIILSLSILEWATISSLIQPISGLNKTKRTLVDTATYGEKPTPIFYALPDGARPDFFATTKTFAIAKPPLAAVFDPEVPKQVAAQQVLYEYQQTPTNAVSNVHVKQLFQPLEISDGNTPPQNNPNGQIIQHPQQQQQLQQNYQNGNNVQTSETVVNPVHHSSLVNHGQNYAHVQLQPYFPQHTQTQHYVPGRYLYVNGKYIYPPLIPQTQYPAQSQNQFQNANPIQPTNKPSLSYITFGNPKNLLRQKLTPPPTGAPMNYNKFTPPLKQDIQQITKPVKPSPKVREEVDEEEENSSLEKEDDKHEESSEEEEDDDKSSYEEESDENDDRYGKYNEDEDEELGSYSENHEEEDEDDDNERKASRVVRVHNSPNKSKRNNPNRKSHKDKNNYAWSESYSHSSRYENGKKKADKVKESKKYDANKKKAGKRKSKSNRGTDKIEGRYSQHVPVVQEHKLFREKWYLTQSKNGDKKL